jgi:hypothetical protein
MLLNLALLLIVYAAEKKRKLDPYVAAAILGVINGAIHAAETRRIGEAALRGASYAALAVAWVFLLKRVNAPAAPPRKFKWEYLPLAVLALLIVAGDQLRAALGW